MAENDEETAGETVPPRQRLAKATYLGERSPGRINTLIESSELATLMA